MMYSANLNDWSRDYHLPNVRTYMVLIFIALIFSSLPAVAADDLLASTRISSQGLRLQSERLKIIAQNVANADTTAYKFEEEPYTRKVLYVKRKFSPELGAEITVVNQIAKDKSEYKIKYEPNHPAANADGYVRYPNVDPVIEMADAKEAQRSYEANLSALEIARSNQSKILEALK